MSDDQIRKHIRFYPEPLEIALIDTDVQRYADFNRANPEMKTQFIALIENESHKGATLVFVLKDADLNVINDGAKWLVQLGKLSPLKAEVKWHRNIDTFIVKAGIALLD
ncbi:MAG: hypothetical protein OEV66_04490 [Spirochaetia bacterium]|nr:hypothetical protein [Spirochaetia bacterium]